VVLAMLTVTSSVVVQARRADVDARARPKPLPALVADSSPAMPGARPGPWEF